MDTMGAGIAIFWGLIAIISIVFTIIIILEYVFGSIGLYSIIKRRGLKYPGFAWVPILRDFSMGKISDDARIRAGAKKSSLRKWILGLSIASYVCYDFTVVLSIIAINADISGNTSFYGQAQAWTIVVYCLIFFIVMAYAVLSYVAMYNIFKSCSESYVVFTVLSIILTLQVHSLFSQSVKKTGNSELIIRHIYCAGFNF